MSITNKNLTISKWLEFLADLLTVPVIETIKDNKIEGLGKFVADGKKQYIAYKDVEDEIELLKVLTHEFRHFYQFYCVSFPKDMKEVEEVEEINLWEKNFNNYIPYGEEGYGNQVVEIDSVAFATAIFLYFDILPQENKDMFDPHKISDKVGKILNEFSMDDVLDSLAYAGINYNQAKEQFYQELILKIN